MAAQSELASKAVLSLTNDAFTYSKQFGKIKFYRGHTNFPGVAFFYRDGHMAGGDMIVIRLCDRNFALYPAILQISHHSYLQHLPQIPGACIKGGVTVEAVQGQIDKFERYHPGMGLDCITIYMSFVNTGELNSRLFRTSTDGSCYDVPFLVAFYRFATQYLPDQKLACLIHAEIDYAIVPQPGQAHSLPRLDVEVLDAVLELPHSDRFDNMLYRLCRTAIKHGPGSDDQLQAVFTSRSNNNSHWERIILPHEAFAKNLEPPYEEVDSHYSESTLAM